MNLISIGTAYVDKFIKEVNEFKKYKVNSISCIPESFITMPILSAHEEFEQWASDNIELITDKLKSLDTKEITFVVTQTFESGIVLVLLEACRKLDISVSMILIRRDFGVNTSQKILGKVLYGVLYEFIGHGIDTMYYFSYDMMRQVYKNIKLTDDAGFYKEAATMWHKKNVFSHKQSFLDLTGETSWGITEVYKIESLPKLIVLSSLSISDEILKEAGVEIYKMIYYISSSDGKIDDTVEEHVQEVSHVIREFKFYNLGDGVLTEFFVRPSNVVAH